jgi:hypothetical protein
MVRPDGACTTTSRSSGNECVRPMIVTLALKTTPDVATTFNVLG